MRKVVKNKIEDEVRAYWQIAGEAQANCERQFVIALRKSCEKIGGLNWQLDPQRCAETLKSVRAYAYEEFVNIRGERPSGFSQKWHVAKNAVLTGVSYRLARHNSIKVLLKAVTKARAGSNGSWDDMDDQERDLRVDKILRTFTTKPEGKPHHPAPQMPTPSDGESVDEYTERLSRALSSLLSTNRLSPYLKKSATLRSYLRIADNYIAGLN